MGNGEGQGAVRWPVRHPSGCFLSLSVTERRRESMHTTTMTAHTLERVSLVPHLHPFLSRLTQLLKLREREREWRGRQKHEQDVCLLFPIKLTSIAWLGIERYMKHHLTASQQGVLSCF